MNQAGAAPARRRTASREVRRRQLIEATIESIARHGLSGTTMAVVTRIADVSMGLVSFHFQSKENLLHETLLYLAKEHRSCWRQKLAESALTPEAKLAAVIDAHFHEATCSNERIRVWFALFAEARYRDLYRQTITKFDEERTQVVADQCAALIAKTGLDDFDPTEMAYNIESLADGLWLSMMLYPDSMSRIRAKRQMRSYLQALFHNEFATWPGEDRPIAASTCQETNP